MFCQDRLGTHRYSPYQVPPVMGPSATLAAAAAAGLSLGQALPQSLSTASKTASQPAPNAVVTSQGNAVPVKSKNVSAKEA